MIYEEEWELYYEGHLGGKCARISRVSVVEHSCKYRFYN